MKSDRSAGGAGVFVLGPEALERPEAFQPQMLTARGYNEPDVEPPFLVEEFIEHWLSPTADAYLDSRGHVHWAGIGVQRLYDGRYYAGYHAHDGMDVLPWTHQVRAAQVEVGHVLHAVGYQGFYNLDFVLEASGRAHVVELNPRRSALQDGFCIAALMERAGQAVQSISTADYVECRNPLDVGFANLHDPEVVALAVTDGALASSYRWTSLCVVGCGGRSEQALARVVGDLMAIPSNPESMAAEVGPMPLCFDGYGASRPTPP